MVPNCDIFLVSIMDDSPGKVLIIHEHLIKLLFNFLAFTAPVVSFYLVAQLAECTFLSVAS